MTDPSVERRSPWLFLAIGLPLLLRLLVLASGDVLTQDGPNHLAAARVLLDFGSSGAYERTFRLNEHPLDPTWGAEVLAAGLMTFLDPLVVDRVYHVACWLLYATGVVLVLRSFGPGRLALAPAFLPYAFGFPFHMGFWGFELALGLFLCALGVHLGGGKELGRGRAAALALLALGITFSHPVPLAPLVLFVLLASAVRWRDRASRPAAVRACLALAPAGALLAAFLARSAEPPSGSVWHGRWRAFLQHEVLLSFDARLRWLTGPWLVLLLVAFGAALLAWRRAPSHELRLPALLLALAALAFALFSPDRAFLGQLISSRATIFFVFGVLLLLATFPPSRWSRIAAPLVGLLVTLALLAGDVHTYRRCAPYRDEYLSVLLDLPPGSTVLVAPLTLRTLDDDGRPLSQRVRPFLHLSGLAAAERGLVDLTSLQAATLYSPVQYRPEVDPYRELALDTRLEDVPPRIDLAGYLARTPGTVDYVMTWQEDRTTASPASLEAFLGQLEPDYELVRVSRPRGMAKLYRRRP